MHLRGWDRVNGSLLKIPKPKRGKRPRYHLDEHEHDSEDTEECLDATLKKTQRRFGMRHARTLDLKEEQEKAEAKRKAEEEEARKNGDGTESDGEEKIYVYDMISGREEKNPEEFLRKNREYMKSIFK